MEHASQGLQTGVGLCHRATGSLIASHPQDQWHRDLPSTRTRMDRSPMFALPWRFVVSMRWGSHAAENSLLGYGAMMCPQSWRGLPASLQLSQSPYNCPFFTMLSLEVLCPWSFPTVAGASQSSAELRSLLQSFAVFRGVPQSSPEFSSLCRSSSLSAGVAATPSEPLSLGVLRRFFAKLPLSSESFPVISYDAAIAS